MLLENKQGLKWKKKSTLQPCRVTYLKQELSWAGKSCAETKLILKPWSWEELVFDLLEKQFDQQGRC